MIWPGPTSGMAVRMAGMPTNPYRGPCATTQGLDAGGTLLGFWVADLPEVIDTISRNAGAVLGHSLLFSQGLGKGQRRATGGGRPTPPGLKPGDGVRDLYAVRRIAIACRLPPNSEASDRITRVTRKTT